MPSADRCVLWLAAFDTPLPQAWVDTQLVSFTDSERQRLARIRRPSRREQFVVGHALIRGLLRQLGVSTPDIDVGQTGQSILRSADAPAPNTAWHLSLAHSGNKVAALAAREVVGVDLEVARPLRDAPGILAHLGLPALDTTATTNDPATNEAALLAWVTAEARIKAGPRASSRGCTTQWNGCWLAVAGSTNTPETFISDLLLGTYNPIPLGWTVR